MLTLDAVRTAALAPQPWSRLDELVRAELAAGRLVPAVRAEYRQLLGPARETPGLTDDGEDALMDTLDALTGNCARQSAYQNPPILPSEEEVAALPRWARVAFATRCVRRALPLTTELIPALAREDYERFRSIAGSAERAASHGLSVDGVSATGSFNLDSSREPMYTTELLTAISGLGYVVAEPDSPSLAKTTVWSAACVLSSRTSPGEYIRRDFDQLARVASYQQWDDDTPVPPDVFGPLWPEGPPAGWPADPDTPKHTGVEVELLVGERVRDQVAEDEAVNLFNALSRYHLARTGRPLVLDDLRPYLPIRAAVGV